MKFLFLVLFCTQSTFALAQMQAAEKVAMVIGVSRYDVISPLTNCAKDATDVAKELISLKFKVVLLTDADLETIHHTLDSLKKTLKPGGTFLFYFSGHGLEMNNENFLFCKNSMPRSERDIPKETLPLGKVLEVIREAKSKTAIILLDACRNNTIVRSWRGRIPKEGLAAIKTPTGVFIGYAAAPGRTASGGIRSNSLYTEAILKFIDERDQTLDEMFTKVNRETRELSNGEQIPYKTSSLQEEFYFNQTIPGSMPEYRNESLDSLARAMINNKIFHKKDLIEVVLDLKGDSNWSKLSPVMVSIVSRSDVNKGKSIFNETFQMTPERRSIRIENFMAEGIYELMIGVCLLADMNKVNPTMYYKSFCFMVM